MYSDNQDRSKFAQGFIYDGGGPQAGSGPLTDTPLSSPVQTFDTGASRSKDDAKYDFEGFICPLVTEAYAAYMHRNRFLPDGTTRDSDNWQKGIPFENYAKSLVRHTQQFHKWYRGYDVKDWDTGELVDGKDILCAIIFNAQGYLHELIKEDIEYEANKEFYGDRLGGETIPAEKTTPVVEQTPIQKLFNWMAK